MGLLTMLSLVTQLLVGFLIGILGSCRFDLMFNNWTHVLLSTLSILKNRKLTGPYASLSLSNWDSLTMSFLLAKLCAELFNHSNTTSAALMLLPGAIIGAGFAPFSGIILDKMGARKPILIGAILIVLAQLLFSLFGLSLFPIR